MSLLSTGGDGRGTQRGRAVDVEVEDERTDGLLGPR